MASKPVENDLNVELGYRYRSAAVIADEQDDRAARTRTRANPGRGPAPARRTYGSSTRAARRFPRSISSAAASCLLTGAEGELWHKGVEQAARELGVPLDVHHVGGEHITDPGGGFASAYNLTAGGCVLVRPDGFVGWRAASQSGDAAAAITGALSALVGR